MLWSLRFLSASCNWFSRVLQLEKSSIKTMKNLANRVFCKKVAFIIKIKVARFVRIFNISTKRRYAVICTSRNGFKLYLNPSPSAFAVVLFRAILTSIHLGRIIIQYYSMLLFLPQMFCKRSIQYKIPVEALNPWSTCLAINE